MITNENDHFTTSDLSLAAALRCLGATIEEVDHTEPSRALFCFRRVGDLDAWIHAYWAGELKVEPQAYFAALKAVKTRLYDRSNHNEYEERRLD